MNEKQWELKWPSVIIGSILLLFIPDAGAVEEVEMRGFIYGETYRRVLLFKMSERKESPGRTRVRLTDPTTGLYAEYVSVGFRPNLALFEQTRCKLARSVMGDSYQATEIKPAPEHLEALR